MKYILEDKQLLDLICKFINNELYDDNLDWEYDINYDTEELNRNIINFYGDKYRGGDQDEWSFTYVKKEYYDTDEGKEIAPIWADKAPLLEIVNYEFPAKMNSFFADYWKPAFEKWFTDTYGDKFPVKTFHYIVR